MSNRKDFFKNVDWDSYRLGDLNNAKWDENQEYDYKIGEEIRLSDNVEGHYSYNYVSTLPELIKLSEIIIEESLMVRAVDVQINSWRNIGTVRYKINGSWVTYRILHKHAVDPLITVFKKLAGVNIKTNRPSKEGRFQWTFGGEIVDMRVALSNSIYGMVLTFRNLYQDNISNMTLDTLGYPEEVLDLINTKLNLSNGMIFVTGGMGSGKSTSVSLMLNEILDRTKGGRVIMSLEEPVETTLEGVVQGEIDALHGYSYGEATTIRVREAGNVLFLGEINDPVTAQTSVNLGTTGQLVIATLHSDSTINVTNALITRSQQQVDMEMVGSALSLILWQSLQPKLCDECKVASAIDVENSNWVSNKLKEGNTLITTFNKKEGGCPSCDFTGYHGVVLISECLDANNTYREIIRKTTDTLEIKKLLMNTAYSNFYPLEYDVLRRLEEGHISLAQAKTLIN